jgi:dimethylhistidine N-methyltransferase
MIRPEKQRAGAYAESDSFVAALLEGLEAFPKRVPCKFFYDAEGAALFDRICELPEYYPTRTEIGLLKSHAAEIARLIGPDAELVEFGAGSGLKIGLLLDALERPRRYLPVDISDDYLNAAAAHVRSGYPNLDIAPIAADFTRRFDVPAMLPDSRRRIGFFPGSTIGNFPPAEARRFLADAAQLLDGGGLLIGVDLVKDPKILHAAYNDAEGVTAAFNMNLLIRANRDAGANFAPDKFAHYALYNPIRRCIEMYLVSLARQQVRVADREFTFTEGEPIHTEDSFKYTLGGFRDLAARAGFVPRVAWVDPGRLFSIHWLEVAA